MRRFLVLLLYVLGTLCPFGAAQTSNRCVPGESNGKGRPSNAERSLGDAMNAILDHINGGVLLSDTELISNKDQFLANAAVLTTKQKVFEQALDLVDTYEASSSGPLFVTTGDFARASSTADGKQLARTMLAIQQEILDRVYQGSTWSGSAPVVNTETPIIGPCQDALRGRPWLTSTRFPGAVDPPSNPAAVFPVQVNATMAQYWGRRVAFSYSHSIRPLGLYLSPGEVAKVTVPLALQNTNFLVQVGGNSIDNANKNPHRRLDRITTTILITGADTYVANPLGGALYLRVPYPANAGVVDILVTGGVVPAPLFQLGTTDAAAWDAIRETSVAPWSDFESDNYLMSVPSVWVTGYDFSFISSIMTQHTANMGAVSDLFGIPQDFRNNYVLYIGTDLYIKHGSYGIGYPQVNDPKVTATATGGPQPRSGDPVGQSRNFIVASPTGSADWYWEAVMFHELGHAQLCTKYRGEVEAIVNLLYCYVRNVNEHLDLDTAFIKSLGFANFSINAAAANWMVSDNFVAGNEMYYGGGVYNEFQYQARGYAKYPDIARLIGWHVIRNFYHQEHLDFMAGTYNPNQNNGLDERTLRLSISAGQDLTPLIHFWGIPPQNPTDLASDIATNNLPRTIELRNHILEYRNSVPKNQEEFIQHFDEVWPGERVRCVADPSTCGPIEYGYGWYNARYQYYSEQNATAAIEAIHIIVQLYWPDWNGSASESPSAAPSTPPSKSPAPSRSASEMPSARPSISPSLAPISSPSTSPSSAPAEPSVAPSKSPIIYPSASPSSAPSEPSAAPSDSPIPNCASYDEPCSVNTDCCSNKCVGNGRCRGNVRSLLWSERQLQPPNPPPGLAVAVERAKLDVARGLWNLLGSSGYNFELERWLYGPEELKGPFLVHVESNQVVSVIDKVSGLPVDDLEVFLEIPTVEVLFDQIGKVLDRASQAGEVLTQYNPTIGNPERFYLIGETDEVYDEISKVDVDTFVRDFVLNSPVDDCPLI